MREQIDTGDTVLHKPTGEKWLVACVQDGRLSWVGWPEGTAALSDCELSARATLESREGLLREMAAIAGDDHRKRYAERRLSQEQGVDFAA